MGDGKTLHDVQQRLHYRYITAIIAVCLLVACGPLNDVYNPSHFAVHAVVAPPDVAVPNNWTGTSFDFNGLYIDTPESLGCCWIADRATLLVRKRGPADKLVAGFWVPNLPVFSDGQSVRIEMPGAKNPAWNDLEPNGPTNVFLTVPAALRNATGLIAVRIVSESSYVPREHTAAPSLLDRMLLLLHLPARVPSNDDRKLGVVLRYLYFASKEEPRRPIAAPNPAASQAPFFPLGIRAPQSWQEQRRDGVWSGDTRATCCFLAKRASLHLVNPPGTRLVALGIYVPSSEPLMRTPVVLSCSFDGMSGGPPVRLKLGAQNVIFSVPPQLRDKPNLTATLESSVAWVPAKLGASSDKRELSVMLLRVGYI
jgi:hypothetical protein